MRVSKCIILRLVVGFMMTAVLFPVSLQAQRMDRVAIGEQIKQSLVRIKISGGKNSKGEKRGTGYASGFVWRDKLRVVTSLHAMRTGNDVRITLYWSSGPSKETRGPWEAKVKAVHKDADLVLLEVVPGRLPPQWTPLKKSDVHKVDDQVLAFGYPGNSPGWRDMKLNISNTQLGNLRNFEKGIVERLAKFGVPNVDLQVVHFESNSLLPGYSGGPIVNAKGVLVAIGDGGVENGQKNLSWGIPARHLDVLLKSKVTTLPGNLADASMHYSAEETQSESAGDIETGTANGIAYGDFEFFYTKTRSLGEMLESSDNPEDLRKQLSESAGNMAVYSMRFDVYQDRNFGVVIAVPEGYGLKVNEEDELVAQFGDYQIFYTALKVDQEEIRALLGTQDIHQTLVQSIVDELAKAPEVPRSAIEFDGSSSACERSLDGGVLATAAFQISDGSEESDMSLAYFKLAVNDRLAVVSGLLLENVGNRYDELEQDGCFSKGVDCARIDPSSPCATACRWLNAMSSVHLTSFSNFRASGEGCSRAAQTAQVGSTDFSRTVYGISDWESFDAERVSAAEEGLFVSDLEVILEAGQWNLGGVAKTLPLETETRYGADGNAFETERQSLAQRGYQLTDIEISWAGGWKFAGVFQPGAKQTAYQTYQSWPQMRAAFDESVNNGWSLIDLEVSVGEDWLITALYQYDAGPSAYRFGNWDSISAATNELASDGYHMTDLETYWDGQTQYLAAVYSQTASPSYPWVGEWSSFEQQVELYESQGQYLDDLEIFPYNGTRWAIGIFR